MLAENHDRKRKNTLKSLIIVIVVMAVLFAGSYVIDTIRRDPNFAVRHTTKSIKTGESMKINYKSSRKYLSRRAYIPVVRFTPEESTSYTFTVSNIKNTDGVCLKLNVVDKKLKDYVYADNIPKRRKSGKKGADQLTGASHLNKGRNYFIIIEVEEPSKSTDFSGSFDVTVAKSAEEKEQKELKAGETVRIAIEQNENNSVLFRPEESGYYRFESVIVGKRSITGFSGISAIIDKDGSEKKMFGGIAYLDAGNDYYIHANTDETESRSIKTDISCTRVEQIEADEHSVIEVTGETVIEYSAPAAEATAIWSESEGDPKAVVYDMQGVPVNSDNNSGKDFYNNRKDFALVIQTEIYNNYRIFVGGKFETCKIHISEYTGDGTTLGPDTVEEIEDDSDSSGQ